MTNEELKEPEEYVSSIKYLAELIQMDLNFGRKETIPARARQVFIDAADLSKLYPVPEAEKPPIDLCVAQEHFANKGYSTQTPNKVGLYGIVCAETNWSQSLVAVTKNDYQMLDVHCVDVGARPIELYAAQLAGLMWIRLA